MDDAILKANSVNFGNFIYYPDIQILKNSVTFICGKSGCGKSTLLRLFNATLSPKSGEIFYNGLNIDGMDTLQLRRKILLVNQSVYLFNETIIENFNEFYLYRDLPPLPDNNIMKYLDMCCIDLPLDSKCDVLSGGERQRVYLAICLSFHPEVIMLDEPTSALDSVTSQKLLQNVKNFCTKHNITLVIVSHDSSLVDRFSDHIILLLNGGT